MKRHLNQVIRYVISFMILTGCHHTASSNPNEKLKDANTSFYFDIKKPGILDLEIGQTKEFLTRNNFSFETKKFYTESGEEEMFRVNIDRAVFDLFFDENDRVREIVSSYEELRDFYGNGVGTSLKKLKLNYPTGHFAVGLEEDKFANFVTPGHVIFVFDTEEFSDGCFTFPRQCAYDENDKNVVKIRISAFDFTDYLEEVRQKNQKGQSN